MKHRIAIILLLGGLVSTLFLFEEPKVYIPIVIGLLLLFSIAVLVGVTTMKWNYFLTSINKTPEGKIMFTFDDGPAENSLKILDILKKHNVKATFFVIGKNCEGNQDVLNRMIQEGHLIGNHSFSHENKLGWASTKTIEKEIEQTNDLLEKLTGKRPKYYRPPFGITNPNIARAIQRKEMVSVGWTIRSFDTVVKDTNQLIEKVSPRLNKKGHIVLLHDTCEQSVEALDAFILTCRERGIEIVNLD